MAQIYKDMRIAAAKAMGHKGSKKPLPAPNVGDPVLIYHPTKKMASGFRLAHVMNVEKNGRQMRVKHIDGSEDVHHHYNVVPIKIDPSWSAGDVETDHEAQQGGHDMNTED
ncbi:hypothetical protein Pmar_PMAR026760 [Perkinsus marinus ATCC 50983]|uniref:Uncharacterized protein n=1 Tax=Perkinsus marinus (strain ATCC 50983 / TXsc) TaxID=423536 RepID=C5KW75_PERM5|nr:hypothetical protein Pmar_PMAR026760 [Perkinsus marinus ATCC 50983]EER11266.1 hypothetical protein Pmar_PMAR026760 [Perkinsus marinus ATCC 50983]|eukprot:XP_002779471.1 hypothetical protein Pmar_PMAR026760 [Perkinsus marinus ATCC 50983]